MVKIRLNGTMEELENAKQSLESVFRVISESKPYKDRGKNELWRIYLDCEVENGQTKECSE